MSHLEEKFDWFDVILIIMSVLCAMWLTIIDFVKGVIRAIYQEGKKVGVRQR